MRGTAERLDLWARRPRVGDPERSMVFLLFSLRYELPRVPPFLAQDTASSYTGS